MTQYFFNNVSWLAAGGDNYAISASFGLGPLGSHMNFYNNTMYASGTTGAPNPCIGSDSGSYNSVLFVVLQNNHCITNYGPPFWSSGAAGSTWKNQAGNTTMATVEASNAQQSWSTASSQGYTISNLFAPTGPSSGTVTFASNANAANLTSLCSGYLVPLCSDINGNPRPSTAPWSAGAFVYTGKPSAPLQLTTTIH
jgi:hypothetical protein